jgi:antitoxin ParD1/3/4
MAAKQRTRNVALTAHWDRFVDRKVRSGRYQSASEVVRESLRIMEEVEQGRSLARAEVNQKIQAGYDQLQRGEFADPDEVLAEIHAMSKAARKSAKQAK